MPHVAQPNSALARVETYILAAKRALEAGQLRIAEQQMDLALGAMTFAANSQTKLIEAARGAATAMTGYRDWRTSTERNGLVNAVAHAEGPGID